MVGGWGTGGWREGAKARKHEGTKARRHEGTKARKREGARESLMARMGLT
jgi:hypothetical protein